MDEAKRTLALLDLPTTGYVQPSIANTMTLAHWLARKAIKAQWQAQGVFLVSYYRDRLTNHRRKGRTLLDV